MTSEASEYTAPLRWIIVASGLGVAPSVFVGAMGVGVAIRLGLDVESLAIVLAVFMSASALGSLRAGSVVRHLGVQRTLAVSSALVAASLAGIALVASSPLVVAGFLALGGAGNAMIQPAANQAIHDRARLRSRGLLFGIKQAMLPVASLFAGLSVPLIALPFGWPVAFLSMSGVALIIAAALWRERASVGPSTLTIDGESAGLARACKVDVRLATYALVAVLGAIGTGTIGSFLVPSLLSWDVDPGRAGSLLALGAASGITFRVVLGWMSDTFSRTPRPLLTVAFLKAFGAVMLYAFSTGETGTALLVLVPLLFGAGHGWNGLFNLALADHYGASTARATGMVMSAQWVGAIVGPLIFGAVATRASFEHAWRFCAAATLISAMVAIGLHRTSRLAPSP